LKIKKTRRKRNPDKQNEDKLEVIQCESGDEETKTTKEKIDNSRKLSLGSKENELEEEHTETTRRKKKWYET